MHYRALALGLCCIGSMNQLHADQFTLPPCGAAIVVAAKPVLEAYPDYSDFLLQIMQYKQARREQAAHREACPQDYAPHRDTTVTDRPEPLARAPLIAEIDYQQHRTWYNRSTSRSFALTPLGAPALSSERLRTLLGNAGSDDPLFLPMTIMGMQLNGRNDGGEAGQLAQDSAYQRLPYTDTTVDRIRTFIPGSIHSLGAQGNLIFYLDENNRIVLTHGLIHMQSCLSSGCRNQ